MLGRSSTIDSKRSSPATIDHHATVTPTYGRREPLGPARVEDLHAGELEPRAQSEPLRGDLADLDSLPERARDRGFDLGLVLGDRRQHPEAQARASPIATRKYSATSVQPVRRSHFSQRRSTGGSCASIASSVASWWRRLIDSRRGYRQADRVGSDALHARLASAPPERWPEWVGTPTIERTSCTPHTSNQPLRAPETDCTSPLASAAVWLDDSGAYAGPAPNPRRNPRPARRARRRPRSARATRRGSSLRGRSSRPRSSWRRRRPGARPRCASSSPRATGRRRARSRRRAPRAPRARAGCASPRATSPGSRRSRKWSSTMSDLAEVALAAAHRHHRAQLEASTARPAAGATCCRRHGQARRARAERLLGRRPRLRVSRGRRDGGPARALEPRVLRAARTARHPRARRRDARTGFVFRVDMRLRPWGDSGPLAVELRRARAVLRRPRPRVGALRVDQGAVGRRRRPAAWPTALGEIVRPFVYRKYLDYGTHRRGAPAARADPRRKSRAATSPTTSSSAPAASARSSSSRRRSSSSAAGATPDLQARSTLGVLAIARRRSGAARAGRGGGARDRVRVPPAPRAPPAVSRGPADAPLPASETDRERSSRESMGYADWPAFAAALAGAARDGDAPLRERVRRRRASRTPAAPVWLGTLEGRRRARRARGEGLRRARARRSRACGRCGLGQPATCSCRRRAATASTSSCRG